MKKHLLFFLSCFFITIKVNSQVTNDIGLIHHYPINETPVFIDVTGGYTGITNGTLVNTADRFGNAFGAIEFDSATYVEIPYVIYPNIASGYTITGWIKPYANSGEIINDRTLTSSYSYKYRIINYYPGSATVEYNSYISCYYEPGYGCAYSSSDSIPPSMQWYFFGAEFDVASAYHKYYLNGSIVDSAYGPNIYSTFNNNTIIGNILGPTDENPFKGAMDDIRFYNRSLSTTELDTLFYGYTPPPTGVQETSFATGMEINYEKPTGTLTLTGIDNCDVYIIDVLGRLLRYDSKVIEKNSIKISLPQIADGVYYCRIIDKATGKSGTQKFTVAY